MFDVYNYAWVMIDNKPKQMIVFAVIKSMNNSKNGVDLHYRLVNDIVGTGWGNNEGLIYYPHEIFNTKQELLNSFL